MLDALIARQAGEADVAEMQARQLLARSPDMSPIWATNVLALLGVALADLEEYEDAARFLPASVAERERCEYRWDVEYWAMRVQERIDTTRAALGDRFQTIWQQGIAISMEEAIAYATQTRGPRTRPKSGWASLTPAELDVARLVGDGLANTEIAQRLFVSVRTVQAHIRHIFDTLGYTSPSPTGRRGATPTVGLTRRRGRRGVVSKKAVNRIGRKLFRILPSRFRWLRVGFGDDELSLLRVRRSRAVVVAR